VLLELWIWTDVFDILQGRGDDEILELRIDDAIEVELEEVRAVSDISSI
jgi:hypothetical protein